MAFNDKLGASLGQICRENLTNQCRICVQIIFDNILNRNIPWPAVSEYISSEAQDLIDRYVQRKISVGDL